MCHCGRMHVYAVCRECACMCVCGRREAQEENRVKVRQNRRYDKWKRPNFLPFHPEASVTSVKRRSRYAPSLPARLSHSHTVPVYLCSLSFSRQATRTHRKLLLLGMCSYTVKGAPQGQSQMPHRPTRLVVK